MLSKCRDIKFRGKCFGSGVWVIGSLVRFGYGDRTQILIWSQGRESEYDVTQETVGEFTGLKDKNGKEIYEGDIVYLLNGSEGNILAEVKWHEFGWRFKKVSADSWHLFQWKDDEESIEIIGNIYENPELLKETKC